MIKQTLSGILLIIAMLLGDIAFAVAPPAVRISMQSVVTSQQGKSLASATYIGNDLFVGCCHAVDNGDDVLLGGREATVIARNEKYDICIMKATEAVTGLAASPVATGDIKSGDVVFGVGYGVSYSDTDGLRTVKRRVFAGVVRGFISPDEASLPEWYVFYSLKGARSGDSGGAVFNTNGELIGNLWGRGQAGRLTYAVDNVILRDLLEEVAK